MRCNTLLLSVGLFLVVSAPAHAGAPAPSLKGCDAYNRHFFLIHPKAPGVNELYGYLLSEKISSPLELQRRLQKDRRFGELMEHYTLMGVSHSPERVAVSERYPRKIFYGENLVVAFTNHPDPKHDAVNHRMQVISWNDAKGGFDFTEIDFNHSPPTIDRNPNRCRTCHGQNPGPIWSTYRMWPGAYVDSWQYYATHPSEKKTGPYSGLNERPNHYFDAKDKEEASDSPPAELGNYLQVRNLRRIALALQKTEGYSSRKYATLAAVIGCPDLPSFLEHEPSHQLQARFETLLDDTKSVQLEQHAKRRHDLEVDRKLGDFVSEKDPYSFIADGNSNLPDVPRAAGLRLLFDSAKFHFSDYSLDHRPTEFNYAFNNGNALQGAGLFGLVCELVPAAVGEDSDLKPLLEIEFNNGGLSPSDPRFGRYCDLLKTKSLGALDIGAGSSPSQSAPSHR